MRLFTALLGAILLAPVAFVLPARADQFENPWIETRLHPENGPARIGRGYRIHRPTYQPTELRPAAQLLAEAQRFEGSGKVTRYRGPWCRDFINLVASRAGYRLANYSRRAIDALHLGRRVADPQPGDLVVMRHHVTIFAGRAGGKIVGLGGNQGRRVRYSHFAPGRVVAFVRL